jgi:hypothetical protein
VGGIRDPAIQMGSLRVHVARNLYVEYVYGSIDVGSMVREYMGNRSIKRMSKTIEKDGYGKFQFKRKY